MRSEVQCSVWLCVLEQPKVDNFSAGPSSMGPNWLKNGHYRNTIVNGMKNNCADSSLYCTNKVPKIYGVQALKIT